MFAGVLPEYSSGWSLWATVIMVLLFQDIIFNYNQSNMPQTWGESCTLHYFLTNILLLLKSKFTSQVKDQQQPVQSVIITFMPRQILNNCWSQLIFFEDIVISNDAMQWNHHIGNKRCNPVCNSTTWCRGTTKKYAKPVSANSQNCEFLPTELAFSVAPILRGDVHNYTSVVSFGFLLRLGTKMPVMMVRFVKSVILCLH